MAGDKTEARLLEMIDGRDNDLLTFTELCDGVPWLKLVKACKVKGGTPLNLLLSLNF
jgi:hypothetical protein